MECDKFLSLGKDCTLMLLQAIWSAMWLMRSGFANSTAFKCIVMKSLVQTPRRTIVACSTASIVAVNTDATDILIYSSYSCNLYVSFSLHSLQGRGDSRVDYSGAYQGGMLQILNPKPLGFYAISPQGLGPRIQRVSHHHTHKIYFRWTPPTQ